MALSVGPKDERDIDDCSSGIDEIDEIDLKDEVVWLRERKLVFDDNVPSWIFRVKVSKQDPIIDFTRYWKEVSSEDYHPERYKQLTEQNVGLQIYWYYGLFDPEGTGDDDHNMNIIYNAWKTGDTVSHDYTDQLEYLGQDEGEFVILMSLGPRESINHNDFPWFMNVEDIVRLGFGQTGAQDSLCLSVSHTGLLTGPTAIYPDLWFHNKCGCSLESIQEYGIHPFFELNDGRFNVLQGVDMMFQGCEYLNYIQDSIFETPLKETWPDDYIPELEGLTSTFAGCKSLKKIPSSLGPWVEYSKQDESYMTNMMETFSDCSSLQELPDYLTKDFLYLISVESMCKRCTSLTSLPEDLFTNCPYLIDVQYAFKGCTGLKHLPPLWKTLKENQEKYSSDFNCTGCFEGCNQADNYDEAIQNGWA